MSQFTEFTSVQIPSKEINSFILLEDMIYHIGYEGSGDIIKVPKGFKTDFATLPFIARAFFMQADYRWGKAAILHDYIWSKTNTLKGYQEGNDIFYSAMINLGNNKILSITFYISVCISKYIYFIFFNKKTCND